MPSSVPYISDILNDENQLFIALTETGLREHKGAEVWINGYKLFRSDRIRNKKKRGRCSGRVALYINEAIATTFKALLNYSNGVNEILVAFSEKENILIAVIYRQPNDSTHGHPSTHKEFVDIISKLNPVLNTFDNKKIPNIFITGDFNLPHVAWPEGLPLTGTSKDEKPMLETLNELCCEFQLSQCITDATHKDGNILDLLLTNNQQIIHSYCCIPSSPSISHHSLITVKNTLQ